MTEVDSDRIALRRQAKIALDAGNTTEAVRLYRDLLGRAPDDLALRTNLGVALHRAGDRAGAIACFRAVVERRPDLAVVQANLGTLLGETGDVGGAVAAMEAALSREPDRADWTCRLGELHSMRGALEAAEVAFDRALALAPDLFSAIAGRADARFRRGRRAEAAGDYRRVLERAPDTAAAWNALGLIASSAGDADAALAHFRRAVSCAPDLVPALINLGSTLVGRHALTEALDCIDHAIDRDPESASAWLNRSVVLLNRGCAPESAIAARRAFDLSPGNASAMSNLLAALQYDPDCDAGTRRQAAIEWGSRLAALPPVECPARTRDPARKLRLGYLSGDLRGHPVGIFMTAVLPHHDRKSFEVTCYANQNRADAITRRLKAASDRWIDVAGIDDETLARQIAADGIDILIDLSGHTAGGRMGVFARRPAPVQAGWIGYFATTGVPAIDRIVADQRMVPPDEADQYSERPLYLPDTYVTFAAPEEAPALVAPPMAARGSVTFGCFNNAAKIGPRVIALWARVLAAVPGARLSLRTGAFGDAGTVERFRALFRDDGLDPARIDFAGHSARGDLLAAYNDIDIALDPFPFNGGITTIETLWMGVPVVTLRGDRYCGHHSESSLVSLGLADLVAADEAGYVECATKLASDPERLTELRGSMRDRFARSTLGDNARFVRDLEAGFRRAWADWCGTEI